MRTDDDWNELLRRQEQLNPELAACVETGGMFPMLRHPLVYMVPFHPQMAALVNAQLRSKKKLIAELLAKGDVGRLVWLYERPYRVEVFQRIGDALSDPDWWRELGELYTDSENVHETWPIWEELFASQRPGREHLMRADEKAHFDALPDTITVWCGCRDEIELDGMSWTTSQKTALWFARRYARFSRAAACIVEGTVRKADALAYFSRRGESEIIAHRRDVHGRKVIRQVLPSTH